MCVCKCMGLYFLLVWVYMRHCMHVDLCAFSTTNTFMLLTCTCYVVISIAAIARTSCCFDFVKISFVHILISYYLVVDFCGLLLLLFSIRFCFIASTTSYCCWSMFCCCSCCRRLLFLLPVGLLLLLPAFVRLNGLHLRFSACNHTKFLVPTNHDRQPHNNNNNVRAIELSEVFK